MSALKLQEVSLYALPAIRYAVPPKQITDEERKDKIIEFVAEYFKISIYEIKKPHRYQKFVYPRHLCQYAIRQKTKMSLKEIGRYFNKDHTTIINACTAIQNYMDTNPEKKAEIEYILANCLL